METPTITCPYCWQTIAIEIPERSAIAVELVTDCEVCCRPILVTAWWEDPDYAEPSLTVEPEN